MNSPPRIVVVDDEASLCDLLAIVLKKDGYVVHTATNGIAALEIQRSEKPDLFLTDLKMHGMDGIELLRRLKAADPDATVLMMTAYSTWQTAIEAMRLGAWDYIRKPFDNNDVKAAVARALHYRRMNPNRTDSLSGMIIGNSSKIREIHDLVRRVAVTDATVLIRGESGTGKELVARALHYFSPRASGNFITANCGAFTESLLESELFGHIRGAFTGAIADKKGLLEAANGGSFFLDEIGEMSLNLQVKFLRVLEEREFKPVGSAESRHTDCRFITATNRDLSASVKAASFREDLFYRLDVIAITLPSLRERKEDIPLLVGHFLNKYGRIMSKEVKSLTGPAMEILTRYDWPGNVRELENTIQRAVALVDGDEIGVEDIPERLAALGTVVKAAAIPPEGVDLEGKLADIERSYLLRALEMTRWQPTKAARLLGMTFRSFRYKVKKYDLGKDIKE